MSFPMFNRRATAPPIPQHHGEVYAPRAPALVKERVPPPPVEDPASYRAVSSPGRVGPKPMVCAPRGTAVVAFTSPQCLHEVPTSLYKQDHVHESPPAPESWRQEGYATPRTPARSGTPRTATPGRRVVPSRGPHNSNLAHRPAGGDVQVFNEPARFRQQARARGPHRDNLHHTPGGGDVRVLSEPLRFRREARARTSHNNLSHVPAGGKVQIFSERLRYHENAVSRGPHRDNLQHRPHGGKVRVFSEPIPYEHPIQFT
eukprot:gene7909-1412_t